MGRNYRSTLEYNHTRNTNDKHGPINGNHGNIDDNAETDRKYDDTYYNNYDKNHKYDKTYDNYNNYNNNAEYDNDLET